ncbi:M24 family metallopeptidase [Lichenihabitans psoromatis]|uniref:M24 family metallopeptidase n=1 Tax=Lichenihabitans psoromatis TaxID=2528642 RepID=UPI001035616B|nr:Xaa-Pro peptidase family protein [Lichenihabitans psoromatis]
MSIGIGGSTAEVELASIRDMTAGVEPIGEADYRSRLAQAQHLMRQQGLAAVYLDAGSNLLYFTGIDWHPSERLAGAVLTASGHLAYLLPVFETGTFAEQMRIEAPFHGWHENQDPCALLASVLADLGIASGTIGLDETTEFGLAERLRVALAPRLAVVSAGPVTSGCRARKSAAEIALMQRAHAMTLVVQRAAARILRVGITAREVETFIDTAHRAAGAPDGSFFCIVLFGADTAFPHGVKHPKALEAGDMVLIDTGCKLLGYQSDITRSYVFGEASDQQRRVWEHERAAQIVAFEAARIGQPCGAVDDAVRGDLERNGYGPGYALPGLPHRTGHGIGIDIHEAPNFVGTDRTPLAEGMCFSIEPMLCIPGAFGVRLEDHIYMAADGPRWFTQPAKSCDDPFGAIDR